MFVLCMEFVFDGTIYQQETNCKRSKMVTKYYHTVEIKVFRKIKRYYHTMEIKVFRKIKRYCRKVINTKFKLLYDNKT